MTNLDRILNEHSWTSEQQKHYKAGMDKMLELVQKNAIHFPDSRNVLYLCSKIVEWLESEPEFKIELKWKDTE